MPMKVLLVEDNPADARMVRELVTQAGDWHIELKRTARLGTALEIIDAETPDAIVLDLSLPDSRGLATFRKMQSRIPSLPIIVLTGLDDAEVAAQTISEGAADYLFKSELSAEVLVRSLRYGIERKRTEALLHRTQRELILRNTIAHLLLTLPNETLYSAVLEEILQFTRSRGGMFGHIDAEGALVCAAIRGAPGQGSRPAKTLRLPPDNWTGVWGRALTERKPVCASVPPDAGRQPGASSTLAVPLLQSEWLIGLLAISNPRSAYSVTDQDFLERLAVYLAPAIHARIQRDAHERALAAAVSAKEVLLKEVHHRVKNNLQIVASLLSMQADGLPEGYQTAMEESQRRVRSMALLHEQLYTCERPDELDFAEYVASLSQDLFAAYSIKPGVVRLRLELESVNLHISQAVPCGLILNELVTNALKHGFPEGRCGEIAISLRAEGGKIVLRVADTGTGLPPEFDCIQPNTLGLRIVNILRAQLDGTLNCRNDGGASFTLTFPRPA